jgi:two-component system chemotaxis response regulator CheY
LCWRHFIRTVRTQPAAKNIPVLMVTTTAAKDDIVEALRVGVNSSVVKPFTPETMKEKLVYSTLNTAAS